MLGISDSEEIKYTVHIGEYMQVVYAENINTALVWAFGVSGRSIGSIVRVQWATGERIYKNVIVRGCFVVQKQVTYARGGWHSENEGV